MRLALVVAAPLLLTAVSAQAQDGERYAFEKSGDKLVRMDRKTGEMSVCADQQGTLVCKLAADERMAYQNEIDALQERIAGLDERVAKLENSLAARLESTLPSEQDFEKTMSYMERFMRGFMGIVRDMQEDEATRPPQPAPQKT
jgi:flagellar motility protein MotE (MotC chaperone)